ncbi:MAG: type II toxin-antitoxin system VapC family toxin [Gammaproteobacteria bacterium]
MILYLDTSAFLKLYVDEPGSKQVRSAVGQASVIATHLIAYAEMRAGLAKAVRIKRISSDDLLAHKQSLDRNWDNMEVIAATEVLIRRAGDLAEQYDLRGYDSIHLAAAEAVQRLAGADADFRLAVFDGGLRRAALAHGVLLLD